MPDPAPCPSAKDLDDFAGGRVVQTRRAEVEGHLAWCASCSKLVAALIASELPAQAQPAGADGGLEAEAPRYQLLRLLGAGGMGSVYEAVELRSGRRVALKLAHDAAGARGSNLVRRFSREAHIAALLEHPNIVPVFDVGTFPDGAAYYTQRLIEGRSLGSAIAACKTPRERIGLVRHFRELCDAIAYAHRHGIVHRDIKPGNTIVGSAGETWVIDWGLARIVHDRSPPEADAPAADGPGAAASGGGARSAWGDELVSDPALTVAGTSMGTPAYMSPEQARGEVDLVDQRSDVWGLGAVLYELLAGHPPFAGLDVAEVLRRLVAGEGPILPAGVTSDVPPELVAIAGRALAPLREARYASAIELAADVNAWMVGARVSAYSYSPVERLRRWILRYRVLSAVLIVALIAGAGWGLSLRAANRQLAHEHAEDLLTRARRFARSLQWDRTAVYFAEMLALEERPDARVGLASVGLAAARPTWKQSAKCGSIGAIAFSDLTTLVAAGESGAAVAFELESGAQVSRRQLPAPVTAISTCGRGLVALASGATAGLWRPRQDRLGPQLAHPAAVVGVALNDECSLLATASGDGVRVFRLPGGELAARFGEGEAASDVAFLRGRRLLWASPAGLHEAPDALAPREGPAPAHAKQAIRRLSASPKTDRLLAQLEDGSFAAFELSRPGAAVALPGLRASTAGTGVLFPGGQDVLAFAPNNVSLFFDADTGVPYSSLAGLSRRARAAAISADDRWMAAGGEEGLLRVYDLLDVRSSAGQRVPGGAAPTDVAWSPDGALLGTSEDDGSIRLWDAASGLPRAAWGKHHGAARALRFSPGGSRLASGGADGLRVWWVATGVQSGIPGGPSVRALAWISETAVATARDDGAVAVRGVDGAERILHREHLGPVRGLALSPDGGALASTGADGALVLFDLRAGRVAHKVAAHAEVLALAWSRDGRRIATAGQDRELRVWDAGSLALLEQREGYDTPTVVSLDFESPSRTAPLPGALLVATDQGSVAFVEPGDPRAMFSFTTWTAATPVAARFSPDGRRVALVTSEGFLRVVPLASPGQGDGLGRLLRHYKYREEQGDLLRDEEAMTPPALRAKPLK